MSNSNTAAFCGLLERASVHAHACLSVEFCSQLHLELRCPINCVNVLNVPLSAAKKRHRIAHGREENASCLPLLNRTQEFTNKIIEIVATMLQLLGGVIYTRLSWSGESIFFKYSLVVGRN